MGLPKKQLLSKEEGDKIFAEWGSVEYLGRRYESMKGAFNMFEKEMEMWDYCYKNNCSVDDLINSHKKITQLTKNKRN